MKAHKHCISLQEPCTEVYCLQLNFKIWKLASLSLMNLIPNSWALFEHSHIFLQINQSYHWSKWLSINECSWMSLLPTVCTWSSVIVAFIPCSVVTCPNFFKAIESKSPATRWRLTKCEAMSRLAVNSLFCNKQMNKTTKTIFSSTNSWHDTLLQDTLCCKDEHTFRRFKDWCTQIFSI